MSAEQLRLLRARLEEIATEIDIQKRILKQLERDKSLVQCQLNEMVDPVARLPLEISSKIFLQCRALVPTAPRAHHVPMLLLNICNTWTTIALSTPALWTTIKIGFPCTEGLAQTLPIWLQRTRNRPLSISLRGVGRFSDWNDDIYAIIWQNGERLQYLGIFDDNSDEDDDDGANIDMFGYTTPGPLPLLKTLAIGGQKRAFLSPQILQLLRLAPNVAKCVFNSVKFEGQDNFSFTSESLVLPTLRRLEFSGFVCDADILDCLTLPALKFLSVSTAVLPSSVLSFFERTGPPLDKLLLSVPPGGYSMPSIVYQCLHLIPSLARLEIRQPDSRAVDDLLAALTDSSLLPNLHNLVIHLPSRSAQNKESWTTLFSVSGALAIRGIQFTLTP